MNFVFKENEKYGILLANRLEYQNFHKNIYIVVLEPFFIVFFFRYFVLGMQFYLIIFIASPYYYLYPRKRDNQSE